MISVETRNEPARKAAAAARQSATSAAARNKSAGTSTGRKSSSSRSKPPMKTGKAPTNLKKYKGPEAPEYAYGGQQQTKPPMSDTYASTNMQTATMRIPSANRVHFADEPEPGLLTAPNPVPRMSAGLTSTVALINKRTEIETSMMKLATSSWKIRLLPINYCSSSSDWTSTFFMVFMFEKSSSPECFFLSKFEFC